VLRDSFLSMISTGVRLLSSLALFVVLAHVWGPATFGVFTYPYALAAILVRIVDYGFTLQIARDVGRSPERTHEIVGRAIGAKLVLLVPTLVVSGVVALNLPKGPSYLVLLALLLLDALVGSFALFLNIPLRAHGRFDREASISTLANVLFFVATIGAAMVGAGPVVVAAIFVLARCAFLALALRGYVHVAGGRPRVILDRASLVGTLSKGFPYAVHLFVGTLFLQVDTLVIQQIMGASAVGLYQGGMRLLFGALLVGDALHNVFFTSLARVAHDPRQLGRLATQMTRHFVALGVVGFGVLLGGGRLLVSMLFADQFASLGDLVPLFGLLVLVRYSGLAYGAVLTLAERQGVRMLAAIGVLALNVVLDVLLIPRIGLRGALIASAVADLTLHLVCATASWFQYRDLMIDRRSLALLVVTVAVLPTAFLTGVEPLTRGLVATALVLAGGVIGVTGEEWASLSRRVSGRLPSLFARTA
jgi:O-antigen/teichoic acid export membrane protein